MPVRNYVGEFRIVDAGDGSAVVTWTAAFELAGGGNDDTIASVDGSLKSGIEALAKRYGSAARA